MATFNVRSHDGPPPPPPAEEWRLPTLEAEPSNRTSLLYIDEAMKAEETACTITCSGK